MHDLPLRLSQVMLIKLICEGHIQIRHDGERGTCWEEVSQWVTVGVERMIVLKQLKLVVEM